MKTLVSIILALTLTSTSFATRVNHGIEFLEADIEYCIKFKVDKELLGAIVKLVYSNGDIVAVETLHKKRMIIDFSKVKPGNYEVIIEKDDFKRDFIIEKDQREGIHFGK